MYAEVKEADKDNKSRAVANSLFQQKKSGQQIFEFVDCRSEAEARNKQIEIANGSPQVKQAGGILAMGDARANTIPIQRSKSQKEAEAEMKKSFEDDEEEKQEESNESIKELREEMSNFFEQPEIVTLLKAKPSSKESNVNDAIGTMKIMMEKEDLELLEDLLSYVETDKIADFFNSEVTDDDEISALKEGYEALKGYSISLAKKSSGEPLKSEEIEMYEEIVDLPNHVNKATTKWKSGKKLNKEKLSTKAKPITKKVGDKIILIYKKYPNEFDENHPKYFKIVKDLIKMSTEVLVFIGKNLKDDDKQFIDLTRHGIIAGLANMMYPNQMGIHCHAILLSQMIMKF